MRALGKEQEAILLALQHHRFWHDGCAWIYGNKSTTIRLLDSLTSRGLVTKREFGSRGHFYEISEDE